MPPPGPRRRRRLVALLALAGGGALTTPCTAASTTRASILSIDSLGGECELWVGKAGQAPVYGSCEGG